jgi:hypothetical protein
MSTTTCFQLNETLTNIKQTKILTQIDIILCQLQFSFCQEKILLAASMIRNKTESQNEC